MTLFAETAHSTATSDREAAADLVAALKHKPFGMTHPTWAQPTNFFYDTEAEAEAAIAKAYREGSGHLVVGVFAARADRSQAAAEALAKVEALHVPWYEAHGVRHVFTVITYGPTFPADHICTSDCDGPRDDESTEHSVLACYECRGANPEDWDDMTCHPFWPCPTARLLRAAHGQDESGEGE